MSKLSIEALSVKKALEEIRAKKRLLESIKRQMDEARYSIGITAIDYGKPSIKGGIKVSAQERYALLMDKLEQRYYAIAEEVFTAENTLASEMCVLLPVEQAILTDRFINGYSWNKIQSQYYYVDRQLYRIYNRALEKLAKNERCQ